VLLAREGKLEEAMAMYRQALALRPDYVLVYVNYANLLAARSSMSRRWTCIKKPWPSNRTMHPPAGLGRDTAATRKTAEAITAIAGTPLAAGLGPCKIWLAWLLATAEAPELRSGSERSSGRKSCCDSKARRISKSWTCSPRPTPQRPV